MDTAPISAGRILAMFPLGSVLLPGVGVPLHIFEDRYRQLVEDCLAGDRMFGVVLISRGSEVGGRDERTAVGTLARIIEARPAGGGQWLVVAAGTERLRVVRWLEDEPYPRAEVEAWPEGTTADGDAERLAELLPRLRRLLAGLAELGDAVAPATLDLDADPVLGTYQAIGISPLGPADRQALLAAATPGERLEGLRSAIEDQEVLLSGRLRMAQEDPPAFP